MYDDKPSKEFLEYIWFGPEYMQIDSNLFPQVKWEDEEPAKVEVTIKIKN